MRPIPKTVAAALCACVLSSSQVHAAGGGTPDPAIVVAEAIRPMMRRYDIPGMAVGIVAGGHDAVYNYGVASRQTGTPVDNESLFEIGSLSKTFTATLVAVAQADGRLSLNDRASEDFPALRGSGFDGVSLLHLGTHTSGGMPLQVPDEITDLDQLLRYFRQWKPAYAPGTVRTYANPSVGLLGMIAASRLGGDFDALMERLVFQPLGLRHTYLQVPVMEMRHYAQGYTKAGAPIRLKPGVLASEAYGIRSNAGDMLRFVAANMGLVSAAGDLRAAITATHAGYYAVGPMTQDLIWEQYRFPVALADLLAGNSAKMGYEANPAVRIDPPSPPREQALIDKTGSTNGFAAYVAFVPAQRVGIVMLANKNCPVEARVTAAYAILARLTRQ